MDHMNSQYEMTSELVALSKNQLTEADLKLAASVLERSMLGMVERTIVTDYALLSFAVF